MDWFVMVWKKYAQFQGRSQRSEFWYFALFHMLFAFVVIVPAVLFILVGANSHSSVMTGLGVVLYFAYFAFTISAEGGVRAVAEWMIIAPREASVS